MGKKLSIHDILPDRRPTVTDPLDQALIEGCNQISEMIGASTPTRAGTSFEQWAASRLQIRDKLGQIVPFVLNELQKRYLAAKAEAIAAGRPRKFLVLKYRRGGITTVEQGISYRQAVSVRNTHLVTIAHQAESTRRIFRIPRLMHDKDPYAPEIKGPGNTYELEFRRLNSYFFIGTAGSRGFGRGDTLQRVHGSEVAWWFKGPHRREDQRQLIVGLTEAASHGEVVLETTANGSEWFRETYQEAKRGINEWTPIFLPWFIDKANRKPGTSEDLERLNDTLNVEERNLRERHGVDDEMLLWRRSQKSDLKALFDQEYPEDDESCFLMSGSCFFSVERITQLLRSVSDGPRKQHLPGGYRITWKKPEKGRKYVAGTDTSEGLQGCDPNGTGVIDFETGEQVAAIHGLFKPAKLAHLTAAMCKEYNDAFLGVEREGYGHAVIQKLEELGYKGKRRLFEFQKGRAGWSTNGQTRPLMLDDLAQAVEDGSMEVNDLDFLGECLTFRMQGGGKWEHDSGEHDDTLFKWGIAWQMRKRSPRSPRIILAGGERPKKPEGSSDTVD